jgi:class 3 adenylate cyclase/tetratricopeptide (TPR) repeat protein
MDIAQWLTSCGLGAYTASFLDNHIEFEDLPSLTMDDLKEIGVASLGHRRRLLSAIGSLQQTQPHAAHLSAQQSYQTAGERRHVTVLFADIAGFSTLSNELDSEYVHALLSAFFEQVDRIISDFGGRIDKHIGDCAMAVFGAPIAHSDDVRRAVASALAIHKVMDQVSGAFGRPIAAHVGVASGEVVASHTGSSRYAEYTVTGESVNLASRLTGLAKPGETIASADIINTLADAVEADFGGQQLVKGFAAPVEVWRVRDLKQIEDAQPMLVGRDAEVAQCETALRATLDGQGSTIYIRGEPGIGKSSLAGEIRRRAERLGLAVVRARVYDFGTGLDRDPLCMLALALLGTGPEPESMCQALEACAADRQFKDEERLALKDLVGLSHSADERRLLDAMRSDARLAARNRALTGLAAAAARAAPLLIIAEDIHWADELTLHGLAALARVSCRDTPITTLMISRIEGDPLATLQLSMGRPPDLTIELNLLSERDARELAERLLNSADGLINEFVTRAGGNPLFLVQLIRHANAGGLASAIPGSIRSLVSAEIDRLQDADKKAVQAAAVLGNQFSLGALRHMLARPNWEPRALIENRLVVAEQGAFQFAHALIRDGAYASILNADRRRLHAAAAEWFAGRDSVLRAEHLARAEDPTALAAYLAATEELVAQYRVEQALTLLERAGDIAREFGDRFAVTLRQGDLYTELGRSAEAIAAYDQALETAPDEQATAAAKLGKAGALRLIDRNHEALALLADAEPTFSTACRFADLSRLTHLRGNLHFPLGNTAACQAAHERALDYAERCGSVELKARALGGLGDAAYADGRFVTARRRFSECMALARKHGFGRIEVAIAPMLASIGNNAEISLAEAERAIAMAAAAHQTRAELTGHHVAMGLNIVSARPEAVEVHFERAQEIVRQVGARRSAALNIGWMAEAYRQMGHRGRALTLSEEAIAIARESGMSYVGAMVLGLRALSVHDDFELRREALSEGERSLTKASVAHNALWFYAYAIESCLLAGDWKEARRFSNCFSASFAVETIQAIDFLAERGQLLAALGETGPSEPLMHALRRCRKAGRGLGYVLFLRLLDQALYPTDVSGSAPR